MNDMILNFSDHLVVNEVVRLAEFHRQELESRGVTFPINIHTKSELQKVFTALQQIYNGYNASVS